MNLRQFSKSEKNWIASCRVFGESMTISLTQVRYYTDRQSVKYIITFANISSVNSGSASTYGHTLDSQGLTDSTLMTALSEQWGTDNWPLAPDNCFSKSFFGPCTGRGPRRDTTTLSSMPVISQPGVCGKCTGHGCR